MSDNNDNNNKGKKNLNRRNISSSSVLVQLYNNRRIATKVDNMLDEGLTYDYIVEFCESQGLSISKSSLTNYRQKREEAIRTNTPLIQLLDRRMKDNVTYITKKTEEEAKDNATQSNPEEGDDITSMNKAEKIYNDLEFLDDIISKGARGLKEFDVVDTPLAMKAIELKAKITNNQFSGLSMAGLREIQMRYRARESALTEVIMKYVPEEMHDAMFDDMDEAEANFYENLDLTEEDKRATEAFKSAGLDV